MTTATEFKPDCVFIPADRQYDGIDPDECTRLILDGDNNQGIVRTEDGQEFCRREYGEFVDVPEHGKVELLPDLHIVKIDERHHWIDPNILAKIKRIYGVYVFDRHQHFHLCSISASYELHFLGTQYEDTDGLDEYESDELNGEILLGEAVTELVTYWDRHDIDSMLETKCEEGWLPPEGKNGGFALTGIESVTSEGAIEEAEECHRGNDL